ncbi:hypothetical protein [Streptomyces sp. NPDC001787]|uniref:hypothetical protein n=1 Tax=Streptomyces sp. NPDC001787 TaxID=3154523 RepID=UPI00331A52CF
MVQRRLAELCQRKTEISSSVESEEIGRQVDRVLTAAAGGHADLGDLLEALHGMLQEAGAASGLDGDSERGPSLPGTGGGPEETLYLCPSRRCAMMWTPSEGGSIEVPLCAVDSKRLFYYRG